MNEFILLTLIILLVALLIVIIHFFDKHLVNQINLYEKRLEQKGILKRHFIKKKENNNK